MRVKNLSADISELFFLLQFFFHLRIFKCNENTAIDRHDRLDIATCSFLAYL